MDYEKGMILIKKIHFLILVIASAIISASATYLVNKPEADFMEEYSSHFETYTKKHTDEMSYQTLDHIRLGLHDINKRCVIEKSDVSRCEQEIEIFNSLYERLIPLVHGDDMIAVGKQLHDVFSKIHEQRNQTMDN